MVHRRGDCFLHRPGDYSALWWWEPLLPWWRQHRVTFGCWEGSLYCFLVGIGRQVPVSKCDELPLKFEAITRYFPKHWGISVINLQSQNRHTSAIEPSPHL